MSRYVFDPASGLMLPSHHREQRLGKRLCSLSMMGPAFFALAAPAFIPAVWGTTSADGDGQTITGSGLITTFSTPVIGTHRANVRTTSTRAAGKRQVNFRFTGSTTNQATFGMQNASAPVTDDNIYSGNAWGLYQGDGKVYVNSIPQVTLTGGAIAANVWLSLTYDFAGGANNCVFYNAAGTNIGQCTLTVTTPFYISAGDAAGTVVPTVVVEFDPALVQLPSRGGAVAWDS